MTHISFRSRGDDVELEAEYVVVGSGAGGAAAALTLARGGASVCMVEAGAWLDPEDYPSSTYGCMRDLMLDWSSSWWPPSLGAAPLLDLPRIVQEAIDDPEGLFTATHGLALKQLKGRYPGLDYGHWVRRVNVSEGLSVSRLKRAVNAHYRSGDTRGDVGSLFRTSDTRLEHGVFRLQPLKIEVARLSADQKAALRSELGQILAALG